MSTLQQSGFRCGCPYGITSGVSDPLDDFLSPPKISISLSSPPMLTLGGGVVYRWRGHLALVVAPVRLWALSPKNMAHLYLSSLHLHMLGMWWSVDHSTLALTSFELHWEIITLRTRRSSAPSETSSAMHGYVKTVGLTQRSGPCRNNHPVSPRTPLRQDPATGSAQHTLTRLNLDGAIASKDQGQCSSK